MESAREVVEKESHREGGWGQTQAGEVTHGSTRLSSMPLPLTKQASSAHRFWLLAKPSTLGAHNTPCTHSSTSHTSQADIRTTFRLRPPKLASICQVPLLRSRPRHPAPRPVCTSGSQLLAFAPSALANSERPLFSSLTSHPLRPHTSSTLQPAAPAPAPDPAHLRGHPRPGAGAAAAAGRGP